MSRRNSQYRSGSGVFNCSLCGKKTRETGEGNSSVQLCAFCYEEAMLENSLSDGNITKEQFNERLDILKKKYKRK